MSTEQQRWRSLLRHHTKLPKETEWVEFKHNKFLPDDVGEYIAALANSAALVNESRGYLYWGVEDVTHRIVGTSFRPTQAQVQGQELENYLAIHLQPRIDFRLCEFQHEDGVAISMIEIPAATTRPVTFKGDGFLRVGSYKKNFKEHPEKEAALWKKLLSASFETAIAAATVDSDDVLHLIDYPAYFDLLAVPLPDNRSGILNALCEDGLIQRCGDDRFDVTNVGAVLFAKNLGEFHGIRRKTLRVISYRGHDRTQAAREQIGIKGYAVGFKGAVQFIKDLLPANEQLVEALRIEAPLYPVIALREILANALIHQDFALSGTGPMVEIFVDRVEISNPGAPLIDPIRFIDHQPRSRNEELAAFMRRVGICEERGSGIDKTITAIELHQLPPPDFSASDQHTVVKLFAPRSFRDMDGQERIRACCQHACLQYVTGKQLTNESLRKRLGIPSGSQQLASKIIQDTIAAGQIKPFGTSKGRYARYVPAWT